jgi:hypothetical protein
LAISLFMRERFFGIAPKVEEMHWTFAIHLLPKSNWITKSEVPEMLGTCRLGLNQRHDDLSSDYLSNLLSKQVFQAKELQVALDGLFKLRIG